MNRRWRADMIKRLDVRFGETADLDLANIYEFVARASGNLNTALAFIDRIVARCERIGDVPRGGRLRDDICPGLRMVPFEHSAVIAYLIEADAVTIVNVFYGGRDFDALLSGNGEPDDD